MNIELVFYRKNCVEFITLTTIINAVMPNHTTYD